MNRMLCSTGPGVSGGVRAASIDAPRDARPLADLMAALADRTRLRLLFELAGGEASVNELCHRLGCAQPTTSHHLGLLRNARLVVPRRAGRRVIYALGPCARFVPPGVIEATGGGWVVSLDSSGTTRLEARDPWS